jgi:two-component system, NarL family, sensor histidine kinase UhpB
VLSSIVGEAIGALALALTIVALLGLLARARSQRADAVRAIAFEREVASDLLEQADALDRLVAAVAGLADDLDEQRVLDRLATATRQLLEVDVALVVEPSEDGLLVCTASDAKDPTFVLTPLTLHGDALETLRAELGGNVWSVAMPAADGEPAELAVVRRETRPFSPLELAQLRVLGDFGSRARQNARLFTLARALRAQAEERERERARLSDRLLTAEEQERRRLSLALHDGPQQTIAGVGLMLEAALSDLVGDEHAETTRIVRIALDRTRGIVRDLRRLTFALEPITLRDHGFGAAFGELAAQTGEAHGVGVAVEAAIVDQLERPIQVCLYRIAQEALANTIKHAGASAVTVSAHRRRDGSIEFAIADDGSGTSLEELDRRGHHQGVDAMRERASGIGATLRFETTPGGGTTVRVVVPQRSDALPLAA